MGRIRILALDYGSTTVGVAMSDALGITAQPGETIVRKKENHLRQTLSAIEKLVSENDIGLIVLGRPVLADGSDGKRVEATEVFARALQARVNVPITWQDERMTTIAADEILAEQGVPCSERKKYIDSVAASIILRDYMNDQELRENAEKRSKENSNGTVNSGEVSEESDSKN